ncbi:MAG: high-potential iron-sulfur protein [Myxococcota bacterium]
MSVESMNRRNFFKEAGLLGAAAAGAAFALSACGKSGAPAAAAFTCTDTTGLSEAEMGARMEAEYSDTSKVAGKNCENCALYNKAASADVCGGCKVVKGPIHPKGYCKLWAAAPS